MTASATQNERTTRVLRFRAGGVALAIRADELREIVRLRDTTRVPGAAADVVGVMNLRGALVGVVDAGLRLGAAHVERGHDARVLVLDIAPHAIAALCDRIDGLDMETERALVPAPDAVVRARRGCVRAVMDRSGERWLVLDARAFAAVAP